MAWIDPNQTLSGQHIELIPLQSSHREGLLKAANAEGLNKLWYTDIPGASSIDTYIQSALDAKANQLCMPFSVVHKASATIIGSTRFCNLDASNRRLEIGYTWYAKSHQRSPVNTEAKLLLLKFAFEILNCIAVEFRTHFMNQPSRNAILRLGAKQDGILRQHKRLSDGTIRDTVVFSIIAAEWPSVKQNLTYKLLQ
ncbi:GNAT family N-acetyltransferase [Aliikangiella sp. IMCC44653]